MSGPGSDERYVLARPTRLSLEVLAQRSGLHPDMVRRWVALGLLPNVQDARGEVWFETSAVGIVARIQRLRAGLGLNYAAIGLVLDLLDRIDELERLGRRPPWTSTG
ncbi:MAG: MerR family transcriptional regulator [Mycobacterium sp.]|nr:MerR family transcriptional regulator [Mycobacterium sp.]MBV8346802.1 MerR family transcriptional regulator [Mycolicibacterium sp.]